MNLSKFAWLGTHTHDTYNIRNHIDEEKDTHLKLYHGILSQVPNIKNTIDNFGDDFESIMVLISMVRHFIHYIATHSFS